MSTDVNVALVQLNNKTINKNKIIKGILNTGALSTFIKKETLNVIPHTLTNNKVKVQGRYKTMEATKIVNFVKNKT